LNTVSRFSLLVALLSMPGLRFTFRSAPGQIVVNHAALLRR